MMEKTVYDDTGSEAMKHTNKKDINKRKIKAKRRVLTAIACGIAAAGISVGAFLLFGERAAESATVSAGLQQLADDAYIACSAPVGESISFTPEWFDNALQGGAVSAITVTALPPATEGVLLLGHGEVTVGQTIPRETLAHLCFTANEGVRQSSFEFTPTTVSGSCGYSLRCSLSLTDAVNCCPTGSKTLTAVATHSTLTLTGTLSAEDPEGGALRYEITDYPANGTVFLDSVTGHFSYLPTGEFTGSDSFSWRAQDLQGAYSEPSTVEITVRALTTGYLFSDVADATVHSAALRMTEKGLMSGEAVGGKHYFRPHHALNRAAFVTVLLEAAEIECPPADSTGFTDDADIPAGMKGAIRYAKEQGWLGEDTAFRPGDPITRAEAAKIAAKVLALSAPGYSETVEDFQAIPVDAADALYAIYEGGYITTLADGTLAPAGELTRGDAAKFFARILDGKSA